MSGVGAELRALDEAEASARALAAVRKTGPVPVESLPRRVRCQIIPPGRAVLCENCKSVSDTQYDCCPVCESRSLTNVAVALNRKGKNDGEAA